MRHRDVEEEETLTTPVVPLLLAAVTLIVCVFATKGAASPRLPQQLWLGPVLCYLAAEMLAPRMGQFGRFPLSAAAFLALAALPGAGAAWLFLCVAGILVRAARRQPLLAGLADLLPEMWAGLTIALAHGAGASAWLAAAVYLFSWQLLPGLFSHALQGSLLASWSLARERSLAMAAFLVVLGSVLAAILPQLPLMGVVLLGASLLLAVPVQAQLQVLQAESLARAQALREQAQTRTSTQLAELRTHVEMQQMEVEVQHRVLTLVGELFMETALVQSPDEMRPSVLNFVRRVVPCSRASLYELENGELRLTCASGPDQYQPGPEVLASVGGERVRATMLETEGSAHVGAVIPERGILVLSAPAPRWQAEHLHLLQRVASHLPLCLDALHYRELQTRVLEDEQNRRREIARLAARLTGALDLLSELVGYHTLRELVERAQELLPELVPGYWAEIEWRSETYKSRSVALVRNPSYIFPLAGVRSEPGELRLYTAVADPLPKIDVELLKLFAVQLACLLDGADLTSELSDALEQLKQSQAQLVQSSKMAAIGQLAAGVAHELNTPLGAVSIAVELAVENLESQPDRALKRLTRALESVEQMQDIISKLLFYSRDSRGTLQTVDLNKVMQDSLHLVAHTLKIQGVEVQVKPGPRTAIEANANELQQVFSNLLINAKDACKLPSAREKRIQMWLECSDSEARVHVRDFGAGMDEATRNRIFEPFFTTKPIGEGTGLGLSTSLQLIQQHGGKLSCESQPGVGTTFTVALPLGPSGAG